jgi:hypothetical protein
VTANEWCFRPKQGGVLLNANEEDLEELVGFVAAEANHEPNRRRQQRLDEAFAVLNNACGPACLTDYLLPDLWTTFEPRGLLWIDEIMPRLMALRGRGTLLIAIG